MDGKIVRGIAGFYYVHEKDVGIFECRAKGVFRNNNIKPLVGDNVSFEITDRENMLGNITDILPRKNSIIRPAVANVDQAVVIIAASYPKPDLNLLDRFLLMMQMQKIPTAICFNKSDDVDAKWLLELVYNYAHSECTVYMTSAVTGNGIEEFKEGLSEKTTVLAGPSGVGKSSVINKLFKEAKMAVGDISDKIKRGKHTTRHSELLSLGDKTYIMDTPGFTSLKIVPSEKDELKQYYPEFKPYIGKCRFLGCSHISEPDCAIKAAVQNSDISRSRYDNYKQFYEEISRTKKYKG